jgi:hypothetical protein
VIGYSSSASTVLTVILVEENVDPSERAEGDWWGTDAWVANERDRHIYGKED